MDKIKLMISDELKHASTMVATVALYGTFVVIITTFAYYRFYHSWGNQTPTTRKAQQSKYMRAQLEQSGLQDVSPSIQTDRLSKHTMEISQIWVYPIKSIRGCQLARATLTKHGFVHDRYFMLLKILKDSPRELQNMAITKFPNMCLFHTAIHEGTLTVTYQPPPGNDEAVPQVVKIPLEPTNLGSLERVEVNMHGSSNRGFDMGAEYNEWFSRIFGFKVILAYWGGNARPVLGNLVPGKIIHAPKAKTTISSIAKYIPVLGPMLSSTDGTIAFNDCAPYLVVTEESAENVTARLPQSVNADITKFRANIVLKGAEAAFVEDFWAELTIGGGHVKMILTGNCGRCVSLNIDYATGKSGTGRDGQMLKLLSTDRRVDPGMKYSPIFGRYGFASRSSEAKDISAGDVVIVSKRNEERTRFCEFVLSPHNIIV